MERPGLRSTRSDEWSAGQRRSRALTRTFLGSPAGSLLTKSSEFRPVQPDANFLEPPQGEVRSSMSRRAVARDGFCLATSRPQVRLPIVQEWRVDRILRAAQRGATRAAAGPLGKE